MTLKKVLDQEEIERLQEDNDRLEMMNYKYKLELDEKNAIKFGSQESGDFDSDREEGGNSSGVLTDPDED